MSYQRDPFDTDRGPYGADDPKSPEYVAEIEDRADVAREVGQ